MCDQSLTDEFKVTQGSQLSTWLWSGIAYGHEQAFKVTRVPFLLGLSEEVLGLMSSWTGLAQWETINVHFLCWAPPGSCKLRPGPHFGVTVRPGL